jgi:hypothetical protein
MYSHFPWEDQKLTKPKIEVEIIDAEDDNDLPKTTNEWFEKISSQLSFTNYLLFMIMIGMFLGMGS